MLVQKVLPESYPAACREYALPDSFSTPDNFLNTKPDPGGQSKILWIRESVLWKRREEREEAFWGEKNDKI